MYNTNEEIIEDQEAQELFSKTFTLNMIQGFAWEFRELVKSTPDSVLEPFEEGINEVREILPLLFEKVAKTEHPFLSMKNPLDLHLLNSYAEFAKGFKGMCEDIKLEQSK